MRALAYCSRVHDLNRYSELPLGLLLEFSVPSGLKFRRWRGTGTAARQLLWPRVAALCANRPGPAGPSRSACPLPCVPACGVLPLLFPVPFPLLPQVLWPMATPSTKRGRSPLSEKVTGRRRVRVGVTVGAGSTENCSRLS